MNDTNQSIHVGDIDIDFADRSAALKDLAYTPASIIRNGKLEKHNTGVYFHTVPIDPVTGLASMHYETAEQQGWYKIDLLNVGIYEQIRNESHLLDLMNRDFNWSIMEYSEFVEKLIHLGNHGDLVSRLKPTCILHLAMILALIRPGKRHLAEKCIKNGFDSIMDSIWTMPADGSYYFKKAHAVGYATLVKVHACLIIENLTIDTGNNDVII